MRSFRTDSALERRLAEAIAATGESSSEFIRAAVVARADLVLGHAAGAGDGSAVAVELADVIGAGRGGAVHGGAGQARRTGASFADLLEESRRPSEPVRG